MTTRIEKINEELIFIEIDIATKKRIYELKYPTDLLKALSKDLPNPNSLIV